MEAEKEVIITNVLKLDTGEVWTYMLPPKEAVRNAFFQSRGKHNTADYPPPEAIVRVSASGKTVYAGDFVAVLDSKKDVDIFKNM